MRGTGRSERRSIGRGPVLRSSIKTVVNAGRHMSYNRQILHLRRRHLRGSRLIIASPRRRKHTAESASWDVSTGVVVLPLPARLSIRSLEPPMRGHGLCASPSCVVRDPRRSVVPI